MRYGIKGHTLNRIAMTKLKNNGRILTQVNDNRNIIITYEYLSMPSSLFVQTMTHLSAPPDANFLPSEAYATE